MTRSKSIKEYISARIVVDAMTGCWNWTGAMAIDGHPQIGGIRGRHLSARRWIKFGGVPTTRSVLIFNTCDNDRCVNPDHTEVRSRRPTTPQKFVMTSNGARRFTPSLTAAQSSKALDAMKAGEPQSNIARALGVHQSTISRLKQRGPKWPS